MPLPVEAESNHEPLGAESYAGADMQSTQKLWTSPSNSIGESRWRASVDLLKIKNMPTEVFSTSGETNPRTFRPPLGDHTPANS